MDKKYKVVDLFAGAGGLSLGFMQTQKYDIKVAFENSLDMQETYRRNHQGVDVRGDVCQADYTEIQKKYGKIDVVIGGPPCQGFSNANRQKKNVISQNNMLVKQYIRAIRELQPKAFVMENVSMLKSEVHRFYLDQADEQLVNRYDIEMKPSKIILLDKKFLFDGALDVVRSYEHINKYLWPEEQYSVLNVIYKAAKNTSKLTAALIKHQKNLLKFSDQHVVCADDNSSSDYISRQASEAFRAIQDYYKGSLDADEIKTKIEPAIMIQRMLSKAKEIFDNHLVVDEYNIENDLLAIIRSYAVFDYIQAILGEEPNNYNIKADVLCAADYGAPQKRNRFIVMGIKKSLSDVVKLPGRSFEEKDYRTVRDAIKDLEDVPTVTEITADVGTPLPEVSEISDLGRKLRNTDCLYNHIITKTRPVAMQRFQALRQGENFHSLDESLKTNTYTDITRTQNTIYLRLKHFNVF